MWPWSRNAIVLELRRIAFRMRRPYAVRITLIRKESGFMALVYSVTAAPVVDSDVFARRLVVTVNGENVSSTDHPAEVTSFGEVAVPQDSQVVLTLVDIDDAGNSSEPSVVEFTATDTIAPAKPGSFGVTLVREE
jgi:hypothetical protein